MPPKFSLARQRASDLLEQGSILRTPVPVEKLAKLIGASVRYESFAEGKLYGMVHQKPDGTIIIGVNGKDAPTRQRFTIAHEIGHVLLHKNEKLHIDERSPIGFRDHKSSMAIDDHEIEANQFAAELLMPGSFLEKDVRQLPADIELNEAIARLAHKYVVSVEAMTIRLTSLGFVA
jgi:Zn-dependent peptidase ImmA (M78 family)